MSRIFWDTNLFIYYLEGSHREFNLVDALMKRMRARDDELITSTFSLGEVLVRPIANGEAGVLRQYEEYFNSRQVTLVPFDRTAAEFYGRIRQDKSIKAPDAIQLACATATKADLFITNDARLSRKTIPGIDFIVPLDRVYL